jgi:hypothetical protein
MNEIQNMIRKLRIQSLEAHLALRNVEEAGLKRQLLSASISDRERMHAVLRLAELSDERDALLLDLVALDSPLRVLFGYSKSIAVCADS